MAARGAQILMFVLDASVVASWCFPDEGHPHADAAFRRMADESAVVPALFWFELRNVLLMGERRNRLSEAQTVRFALKPPIEEEGLGGGDGWAMTLFYGADRVASASPRARVRLSDILNHQDAKIPVETPTTSHENTDGTDSHG